MKQISVKSIFKKNNIVKISFSISPDLKCFFQDTVLNMDYTINGKELNIEAVPAGVMVIPFICNILPIAWLTDSEVILPEIDKDFFESIDSFKQGYIDMYPDCTFKGKVSAKRIIDYSLKDMHKSASFFSAGVDAYGTLARHILEKPDLITIWGADIPYDNSKGWKILENKIKNEAIELELPFIVIHSSFRKMVNESNLTRSFYDILHDGWWHGAQHGIGLIGHAAPCNYVRGVTTQYIAASFWEGAKLTCASWPTIDNNVRFCGCSTVHDGFIPRQNKIRTIIEVHHKENMPVSLHVCWKTTTGDNCCVCEKCCRTIMGLLAEGEDPALYGFDTDDDVIKNCIFLCKNKFGYDFITIPYWEQIKQRAVENKQLIQSKGLSKYVDWMESFEFNEKHATGIIKFYKKNRAELGKLKRKLWAKKW